MSQVSTIMIESQFLQSLSEARWGLDGFQLLASHLKLEWQEKRKVQLH